MFEAKNEAFMLLESQKATFCIQQKNALVLKKFGRGIEPVLSTYLSNPAFFADACVYDTIVGKAAASIFVLGNVKGVYGETMSDAAAEMLEAHGIAVLYKTRTEQIINRRGDGLCPFEQAVLDVVKPEDCLPVIIETMQKLKNAAK